MTESSQKIRTDFLKSLGIIKPCPCDFEFIEPIPDSQLLKSLVSKSLKGGAGVGLLAIRYGVKVYHIKNAVMANSKKA